MQTEAQAHREEGCVRVEAEIGEMQPQVKEHQGLPISEGRKRYQGFFARPFRGSKTLPIA